MFHLKLLGKTLQVVLVQLHHVFDKLLHWNGLHVICGEESKKRKKNQDENETNEAFLSPS